MNIEIPEEMSLFAELKTLAENVRERCFRVIWRAADWRRTVQCNEEASQEQRSLVKRRAKKAATSWRRRSGGRRCDGLDNPGAPEALCTTRGTVERLGVTDVFALCSHQNRATSRKRRKNAGRCCSDMVEIKPDMERGSPHIWLFNAMLKPHRGDLKEREWRIEPSGPGEGRGVEDAQD